VDLRCEHKLFGVVIDPGQGGVVEFKCSSRFCGAEPGVVVLHEFSTETGKLLGTKRYRDTPQVAAERNEHART
jgi:hypothetical protein